MTSANNLALMNEALDNLENMMDNAQPGEGTIKDRGSRENPEWIY